MNRERMTDAEHERVNMAACAITEVASFICQGNEGLVACAVMEAFAALGSCMTPAEFRENIVPKLLLLHGVFHERWRREHEAGELAEAAVAKARKARPTERDKP